MVNLKVLALDGHKLFCRQRGGTHAEVEMRQRVGGVFDYPVPLLP